MQHEWVEPSVPDPEFIGGVMLVREPGPCFHDHKPPVWHDKAEEFSEEERQATAADLKVFVVEMLKHSLSHLKLSAE